MWTLLFNFLGSGAFGGMIGGLCSYFTKRDELRHEQVMKQLDNAQQVVMAQQARLTIEEQGKQAVAGEEAKAFTKSQEAARDQWRWVRPTVMFYLLGVATYFSVNISLLVGGLSGLERVQLFKLYATLIDQIFFLTNLSVSWFFGARGSSYKPKR